MVVACTWYVQEQVVHSNGVGCVKQNGPETVWGPIGLVKHQFNEPYLALNRSIKLLKSNFKTKKKCIYFCFRFLIHWFEQNTSFVKKHQTSILFQYQYFVLSNSYFLTIERNVQTSMACLQLSRRLRSLV